MVSTFFLTMFAGVAANLGVTSAAASNLFLFVMSAVISLAFVVVYDTEHKKNLGIFAFYFFITAFTFLGGIDWFITIVVFLFGFATWGTIHKEGGK